MKEHARRELGTLDLVEMLALDEEGFKARFAGTPMVRAKRSGLLRNVCVALGNVGDARALPELSWVVEGGDAVIAEHAKWAIGRIEGKISAETAG